MKLFKVKSKAKKKNIYKQYFCHFMLNILDETLQKFTVSSIFLSTKVYFKQVQWLHFKEKHRLPKK